ncbi:MAG TPA: class I SAM-dependent methyltransferase [Candidatus Baltobacteraceae bacterium]|nr:class I SAM-dependent methyltransferase [Candidatus Baltobacteraceae bacterium]
MSFAGRFSDRADDYAAGRPSYPAEAIDALFDGLGDPGGVVVADLGAGTGISSRLLAARGALVFAVEPNAAMRNAAEPDERVRWVDGTAERTGLDEASADLATVFQAFHWFDHALALREIVRVVRPGGRAAVVYNERDESDPFTAAYGALVRTYQTDDTERRRTDGLETFAAFEAWHGGARRFRFRNSHRLDREGLHARARSTSYLPKNGSDGERLRGALDELFDRFAQHGAVTMAMETTVVIGELGADGG